MSRHKIDSLIDAAVERQLVEQAMGFRRRRDWQQAVVAWRRVIALHPGKAHWLARLVEAAARLGDIATAARAVDRIEDLSEETSLAVTAASALLDAQQHGLAERVLAFASDDPEVLDQRLLLRGRINQALGADEAAADAYTASMEAGGARGQAEKLLRRQQRRLARRRPHLAPATPCIDLLDIAQTEERRSTETRSDLAPLAPPDAENVGMDFGAIAEDVRRRAEQRTVQPAGLSAEALAALALPSGPWSEVQQRAALRAATVAQERGDLEGAAGLLQALLARAPCHVAAQFQLSRILGLQGNSVTRIGMLRELLAIDPEFHKARRELARVLTSERLWHEALAGWQELLDQDESDIEAWSGLARCSLLRRDFHAAERGYRRVLDFDPERLSALVGLARSLEGRQAGEANAVWQQVLELEPQNEEAALVLARKALAAGEGAVARRLLQALAAEQPRRLQAGRLLARALTADGAPVAALDQLRALAAAFPDNVDLQVELGRLAKGAGLTDEASTAWRKVLAAQPDHLEALRSLSETLTAAGELEGALEIWRNCLQTNPGHAEANLRIGRLQTRLGNADAAEAAFRQSVRLAPSAPQMLADLAQFLAGNHATRQEAVELYRKWQEAQPGSPEPSVRCGLLLERLGQREQAEASLRRAVTLAPGQDRPLAALAQFLSRAMRWEDLLAIATTWAAVRPDLAEPALLRIQALGQLGREKDVEAEYHALAGRDPPDYSALMGLARIRRAKGQLDEAFALWRRAAELCPTEREPWLRLVAGLATADREPEALAEFARCQAALADNADAVLSYAAIMDAARFIGNAERLYEQAIALLPADPRPRRFYGRFLAREGMLDRALPHLNAARRLDLASVELARETAEVAETLTMLDHDVLDVMKRPPGSPAILVPETLFQRIARIARSEIELYQPALRYVVMATQSLGAGGAERQLATSVRGLMKRPDRIDRVAVFCRSLDPNTSRDFYLNEIMNTGAEVLVPTPEEVTAADCDPVVCRYLNLLERFPEDLGPLQFWVAELRRRRPAVLHAWQDMTSLALAVAGTIAGVPQIILGTRSVRPDNPRRRLRRWMQVAYQELLALPNVRMLSNSRAGADDYADWLSIPPEAIEVVYNGLDFEHMDRDRDPAASGALKASFGIPPEAPVIGGVFRMSEEKRPLLWVEAAALVAAQLPQVHFVVCGDGPMASEMREMAASLGIAERLHMPGNRPDVAQFYGMMDTLLLASRHEGLPNVLMEAQHFGIPVVVPKVGGAAEVLEEGVTGFAVTNADASMLADRLLHCLTDGSWASRARRIAPTFVHSRFGIGTMIENVLAQYAKGEAHG